MDSRSMIMNPHGEFRCGVVDRVFWLEIRGSWNLEGLQEYLQTFQSEVARLVDGSPWASIVDVHAAELSTPDTVEPFNEAARMATEAGRTHLAVVGANNSLQRAHLSQLFEGAGVEIHYFDDLDDAWGWLQELAFWSGPSPDLSSK